MKARAPFTSILKSFRVELCTSLPQRYRLLSVIRYSFFLNWHINVVILWTPRKWVCNGLELSTTTFAVLSFWSELVEELTSEIFCPNCFLHFAYQKCFIFINCLVSVLRALSTNKSKLRTINGQIKISGEKTRKFDTRKTVSNNEK